MGRSATPATALDALRAGDGRRDRAGQFLPRSLPVITSPASSTASRASRRTPWTPIPLLVAAPGVDECDRRAAAPHLVGIDAQPSYAGLLADVLLARFVAPDVQAYRELESMAHFAADAGYETIQ